MCSAIPFGVIEPTALGAPQQQGFFAQVVKQEIQDLTT
jgi:hypothetical protein